MAILGDLVVRLMGDAKPLKGVLNQAQGMLSGFAATLASTLGAGVALNAAGEQIAAERKLEAVLTATGNAAGFTAGELKKMAADLQQVTNFSDEVSINAAAVLATFTQIKGDVFRDALVSAQDLSAVLGNDLQGAAIQIGKALNDPVKGITALSKAGVSFTEEQKKQIKEMVAANDVIGAQRLILAELKNEFGGAAEAMASPLQQVRNALGDVVEEVGKLLLIGIKPLAQFSTKFFQTWGKQIALTVAALFSLVGVLKAIQAAQKAIAVGQALILAMGGPAGWAALAAGAAVFAGSVALINREFGRVNEEQTKAVAKAEAFKTKLAGVAADGEMAAAAIKRMADAQKEFDGLVDKSLEPSAKLAKELRRIDALALELGGHAGAIASGVIKPAAIEAATGAKAKIRELTNELRLLRGEATESTIALEEMARKGTPTNRLKEISALMEQRDAVKAQREEFDKLRDSAKSIFEATRTPAEKMQESIREAFAAFRAGLIDVETFNRSVKRSQEEVAKLRKAEKAGDSRGPEFAQRGSSAALSSILRNQRDDASKRQEKLAEMQLQEQRRMVQILERIQADPRDSFEGVPL